MHITARRSRVAAWIALPLAVVASGAVIATASYAAFSATTDNAANSWRTGGITLTDDDQGQALFDVADLVPGDAGENCITVTADASKPSTVKLFTDASSDADSVAQHIGMTVERGALSTAGDCSTFTSATTVHDGTLAGLTAKTSFADGVDAWTPAAGGAATTYRFSYDLDAAAPNTAQNATATTTFVWEAQSN